MWDELRGHFSSRKEQNRAVCPVCDAMTFACPHWHAKEFSFSCSDSQRVSCYNNLEKLKHVHEAQLHSY